jgi:spore coat protein A
MGLTRRDLLRLGAVAGARLALPRRLNWAQRSPDLAPFVDALPVPPVLPAAARYDIHMRQILQKLHRDLPATRLWAYHGTYVGPTFEVRSGVPIEVQWLNELPARHLLPIDHGLHGAEREVPEVRTVVHLHGAKVLGDSDGHPEAWFARGFEQTGRLFSRRVYHYPNDQAATTLWYHDHALGITRLNVYAGLAGFYIIRDEVEDGLPLPKRRYEIPLMFQDRSLNADGSLDYPVQGPVAAEVPPVWIPELFADTGLVNGKVMPYLNVEPRRYRFRMLNACNARFLNLSVVNPADPAEALVMHQIGSDQGFLPRPVEMAALLLAPAERADVVIDFSGKAGKEFLVQNDAPAPFPDGGVLGSVPMFLQFRVGGAVSEPDRPLPAHLVPAPVAAAAMAAGGAGGTAVRRRRLLIAESDAASGDPLIGLLGTLEKGGLRFHAPVTEDPRAGSTEVWELYNATSDAHPIHLHLVRFQVLDRQPFDLKQFQANGTIRWTGPPEAPAPNESQAWKDVVRVLPGDADAGIGRVTRIVQTFDLPRGAAPPGPAAAGARALPDYMWHCHILEHEDNEMMRPLRVC